MAKRHVRRAGHWPAEATEVGLPAVTEAGGRHPHLELRAAELRVPAATRHAAHVDNELHARPMEQPGQLTFGRGAMPDGEQAQGDVRGGQMSVHVSS